VWPIGIFWYILWSFWYILWWFGIFCGDLVYFVVIWYILWWFGIFCGDLVYFVVIWYILWWFGIFCRDLVYFVVIWYILSWFGIFCRDLVYFVVIWYILWYIFPCWFTYTRNIWQPIRTSSVLGAKVGRYIYFLMLEFSEPMREASYDFTTVFYALCT
jgi:hypothetical protein